jgi:hypothetical protein
MLAIIPNFLIFLVLAYVYGVLLFIVFKQALPKNLILPIFPGIAILGILSQWFLLGGAINFFVFLVLVFGALIAIWRYSFYYQTHFSNVLAWFKSMSKGQITLLLSFLLLVLYQSALPTQIHDMAAYYLQTLQWMQKYGVVYGLGNLYPALGLGSAWHSLLSIFQIPGFMPFYAINACLVFTVFLFLFFTFLAEPNMKEKTENPSDKLQSFLYKTNAQDGFLKLLPALQKLYLLAYSLFLFPLAFLYLTAPSPDLALLVFTPLLLYFMLLQPKVLNPEICLILACFIFAVKPPALLAIALGALLVLNSFKPYLPQTLSQLMSAESKPWLQSLKTLLLRLFIVLFCLSPVLSKNYIQTGYVLYPLGDAWVQELLGQTGPETQSRFNPKWKIPQDFNVAYRSGIIAWGYTDSVPVAAYKGNIEAPKSRLVTWLWRGGYKGVFNQLLFLNACLALFLVFLCNYRWLKLYLLGLVFLSVVEWFFLNQYRLMLPLGIALFGLNLSALYTVLVKPFNQMHARYPLSFDSLAKFVLLGILVLYMGLAFVPAEILKEQSRNKSITSLKGFNSEHLVKPYTDYAHGTLDSIAVEGMWFYSYSDKKYMWNAPMPALSKGYSHFLKNNFGYQVWPLGKNAADGFYMK